MVLSSGLEFENYVIVDYVVLMVIKLIILVRMRLLTLPFAYSRSSLINDNYNYVNKNLKQWLVNREFE